MIDDGRRTFLKECAALATLASAPLGARQALAAGTDTQVPARHIACVLIDQSIEEARAFAAPLSASGATLLSVVDTDVEELWRRELRRACLEGNAIAGLTAHSALFVCAAFARDVGARVRHEAQHDCRGGEVLTHRLPAGKRSTALEDVLAHAGAHWPVAVAAHIAALPAACVHMNGVVIRTDTRRSATHPGTLFSWLIA